MTIFDSILLGFIQALTEFLPISSSGHLVLAQKILGYNLNNLIFEVILHFGTLFSIVIFFWNDLKKIFLNFISAILKYIIYSILFNTHRKTIYKMRICGIYNSLIGKKSYFRIDN